MMHDSLCTFVDCLLSSANRKHPNNVIKHLHNVIKLIIRDEISWYCKHTDVLHAI